MKVRCLILLMTCLLGAAIGHADEPGKIGCLKTATLKIANQERVITLAEAKRIKLAVDRYWSEAKPRLEPSVFALGPVSIDCYGTVRMGDWILEPASAADELRLAFRVGTTEHFIVRQIISLREVNGRWRAMDTSLVRSQPRE